MEDLVWHFVADVSRFQLSGSNYISSPLGSGFKWIFMNTQQLSLILLMSDIRLSPGLCRVTSTSHNCTCQEKAWWRDTIVNLLKLWMLFIATPQGYYPAALGDDGFTCRFDQFFKNFLSNDYDPTQADSLPGSPGCFHLLPTGKVSPCLQLRKQALFSLKNWQTPNGFLGVGSNLLSC